MTVAEATLLFSVSLFLFIDLVKYAVIRYKGQKAWDSNKDLVTKLALIVGVIFGVILRFVYDIPLQDAFNTIGIGALAGLSTAGLDKIFDRKDKRTLFGTPPKK